MPNIGIFDSTRPHLGSERSKETISFAMTCFVLVCVCVCVRMKTLQLICFV